MGHSLLLLMGKDNKLCCGSLAHDKSRNLALRISIAHKLFKFSSFHIQQKDMTTESTNLEKLPRLQKRACFKEIRKNSPEFRSLRRHTTFLTLLISALVFTLCYTLREQLGLLWFFGSITATVISDWWIERFFMLPYAVLYLKKAAEQDSLPVGESAIDS